MALLPYVSLLESDHWRPQRQDPWDSPPESIWEAVRDYQLQQLHCKVLRYVRYEMVALSAQSPSTVRVFLSALERFYSSVLFAGEYQYVHSITNPVVHLLQEVDEEDTDRFRSRPKMPPERGIEEPESKRPSDDCFRLVDTKWIPEPIDNPTLCRQKPMHSIDSTVLHEVEKGVVPHANEPQRQLARLQFAMVEK